MRRLLASRGTPAFAVGIVMLLVAGGGYAMATGGTISACVHKHGGVLYVGRCAKKDKRLTWSIAGPQGQRGPQGVQGSQGPQGNTGSTGPSDAYSAYKNGPLEPLPSSMSTIASLQIPNAGDYVIFAKVVLHDDVNTGVDIACQLVAGGDVDHSQTTVEGNSAGYVTDSTAALNVVHAYNGPGTANLQCDGYGVDTDATWIKITAIRVGSLTNTPSS